MLEKVELYAGVLADELENVGATELLLTRTEKGKWDVKVRMSPVPDEIVVVIERPQ